jgi:hypothetical protein
MMNIRCDVDLNCGFICLIQEEIVMVAREFANRHLEERRRLRSRIYLVI